jgi:hypothetical protein
MTTAKTSESFAAASKRNPFGYSRKKRKWKVSVGRIAAFAGIVGPIVIVLADLISTSANPGYSPLVNSVSEHVLDPLGWLQTLSFYLF